MIGNAHHIKLGAQPGDETPWDSSFEDEFDPADSGFPDLILRLQQLETMAVQSGCSSGRWLRHDDWSDDQLKLLTECVVSLAIRSPRNRNAWGDFLDHFGGGFPNRNSLIAANMQRSQRMVADSIGASAKFAVLVSRGKEFIFGDGFFHNLTAQANRPHTPKLLAPITPTISVIVTRPLSFMVDPRLSVTVLSDEEVIECNRAVQVFSRDWLFFRSELPQLEDAFAAAQHQRYEHPDNPIDCLIRGIPGIPPRDRSLDFLLERDL